MVSRRSLLMSGLAVTATPRVGFAMTPTWDDLRGIQITEIVTETTYEVKKSFPENLLGGVKGIVLSGYAAPLSPGEAIWEMVLTSDLSACPYCNQDDHGATALVRLSTPAFNIEPNTLMTLRGDFKPNFDPTTWEAAIIENAVILG